MEFLPNDAKNILPTATLSKISEWLLPRKQIFPEMSNFSLKAKTCNNIYNICSHVCYLSFTCTPTSVFPV